VIIVVDPVQAEAELGAGRLGCPHCGGQLARWAHGRPRRVRMRDGSHRSLRPRRARCHACGRTQVLLPGWCSPRRGDATEVIGAALLARAGGMGWRRIAASLDRPAPTVRRWLRGARGGHLQWLYQRGVQYAATLDPEVLLHLRPAGSATGDALAALAAAAVAWRRRFGAHTEAWTLIGAFTGGLLPVPAD
jgi:hypothetical protein